MLEIRLTPRNPCERRGLRQARQKVKTEPDKNRDFGRKAGQSGAEGQEESWQSRGPGERQVRNPGTSLATVPAPYWGRCCGTDKRPQK